MLPGEDNAVYPCGYACDFRRNILSEITIIVEGYFMKIVVFRSPKALSGILKMIFKINSKED